MDPQTTLPAATNSTAPTTTAPAPVAEASVVASPEPTQPVVTPEPAVPALAAADAPVAAGEKSFMVTLLLAILLGTLGVDRFYTGDMVLGVLKLITGGGLGIWWLIYIIMIVTGARKDHLGQPLSR